jgi:uncharacterized protein
MSHHSPTVTAAPAAPEPITPPGRSLAPDLARGVMLLGIVLAHIPFFVTDWSLGPAALNDGADFLRVLLADNQARVMFVLLFGYGLGQLAYRRAERGTPWPTIRKLLRRRSFWLLVIGFLHCVVLVPLDFISVYGLTLLLFAGLVRASDKVLLRTGLILLIPATAMTMFFEVIQMQDMADGTFPASTLVPMADDFGAHLVMGLQIFPAKVIGSVVMVLPVTLLGLWAARRRYLDRPEEHTGLLRRLAVWCVTAAVLARLPFALTAIGAWSTESDAVRWGIAALHATGGLAGAVGAVALVALAAIRIGRTPGPAATAVAALGQRSMTFYIFQSAVFLVLFYPFTLGLSGDFGVAAAFAVGVGIWAASVLLAEWMRRVGHRGPFELAMRRLSER